MQILSKIRLDAKGLPYWSSRLVHEGDVVLEIISDTFNPRNGQKTREMFENVSVRIMKEIQTSKDSETIIRMLIQEDHGNP